jgi:osmotically-inducible protein OsmY
MAEQDVALEIQKIIDDDPIIGGKNITVSLQKGGFLGRDKSILLVGKLDSDRDRKRAEEIATKWAGKLKVVNKLLVGG